MPLGGGARKASVAPPSIQICSKVSSWTSDGFRSSSIDFTDDKAPVRRYSLIRRNLAWAQEGLLERMYSKQSIARRGADVDWVVRMS